MNHLLLTPYSKIHYDKWKLEPHRSDCHLVIDQELAGNLDIPRLAQAAQRFIIDHVLFNSHVAEQEGNLYWVENPKVDELAHFEELTDNSAIITHIEQPFNLEEGPLYRFMLIKKEDNLYRFIVVLHRILLDRSDISYFIQAFSKYYNDAHYHCSVSIPEQMATLLHLAPDKEFNQEENLLFWQEQLAEVEPLDLTFLRLERSKSKVKNEDPASALSLKGINKIAQIRFGFDKEVATKLAALHDKYQITPYVYGQSIYALLLHKYTGQAKFCMGYYRSSGAIKDFSYGAQINSDLLTVYDFSKVTTIVDVAKQIQAFAELIKAHNIRDSYLLARDKGSVAYPNLVPVSFNEINLQQEVCQFEDIKAQVCQESMINLNHDLVFEQAIYQEGEAINYQVNYQVDKIDTYLLEQFIGCYKRLFVEVLEELIKVEARQELKHIQEYRLLSAQQYQQIVVEWNATEKKYPREKTIQELFEEQVERTPDHVAIVYGETKLNYRELNERSNQLASYLRQTYAIKPDDLIVLCLDKSEQMLIAILAILKSGGAYVPIDPSYPDDRIGYLLGDTHAKVVLASEVYQTRLEKLSQAIGKEEIGIVAIDNKELRDELLVHPATNFKTATTSTNLAYVIYTSGTTGNPKGVMIEHKSVNRLIFNQDYVQLSTSSVIAQASNIAFDAATFEIWGALLVGGRFVILSKEETLSIDKLRELIKHYQINTIFLTTALFNRFITEQPDIFSGLRYLLVGGEIADPKKIKQQIKQGNVASFIHVYGPTEATTFSTYYSLDNTESFDDNVPIGQPIANTQVYILDGFLNPVPIGAIGELYIGGEGLARGYLNRPELTKERFIMNPFQTDQEKQDKGYGESGRNARLYKTGDLVRWLSDGNLEYIGRNDFQVKIRGYRIELGEIEAALSTYPGIKQSVVLAEESKNLSGAETGHKYLLAYYVKELASSQEDAVDFVEAVNTIYQAEYTDLDINNFKLNTNIWISSYTGKAIGKEHMIEWVDATVNRIKDLKPTNILELGSGSGLILFNIINDCGYYYATDVSSNAIEYTNQVINKFGYTHKVSALACTAQEVPYQLFEKPCDIVILNSVLQHFPDLNYLESVIMQSINHMSGPGYVFVGDISDYRLLNCFHYSVQKYKGQEVTPSLIDHFAKRDKTLVVAPAYFLRLQELNKRITHVEIMPRLGKLSNEMNDYRYDTILHIDQTKETKDLLKIHESSFVQVVDFEAYVLSHPDQTYLCIKYPNKRIISDYIDYTKLYHQEILTGLDNYDSILSLDELLALVKQAHRQARVFLDIYDPLYFYIVVYNSATTLGQHMGIEYIRKSSNTSAFANNPLKNLNSLANQFEKDLKLHLCNQLPSYMVPEYFVPLEKLPLTSNGKLDRNKLPKIELIDKKNYVAPQTELDKKLCKIWADTLGVSVDQVGIEDDFFRLGGNSILAIKLVSKLNKEVDNNIHVATIFKQSTVSKLVHYLQYNEKEDVVIGKGTVINPEKQWLSFAQERLWFIEKYEQGTTAYNIPMVYRLSSECELDLLELSIRAIVDRHEILRTLIKEDNEGTGYQVILEDTELLLKINKISVASQKQLDEALKKEVNHIFNLADEYPIRIGIYELSMDETDKNNIEHYLSIVVHHIAFDGWSMDIFLKELQTYYNYYLKQKRGIAAQLSLPALTIQYKDFALWQRNYLSGDRLYKQLDYWKNKLSGYESLNLLTDKVRPTQIDYTGADIYFELDKATSMSLRALAKELKVSLYSVLLSGYYLMLRSYSNQDDIIVGTPIANRHYSQIEDLIGFFVNSLALRIQIDPTVRVKEFIEQVGEEVVEAQLHQDLPFEKLVEALNIPKDTSKHSLFQVMFSVQSFGGNVKSVTSEKEEHNLEKLLKPYANASSLYQGAKFDLTTLIDDGEEKIKGIFNYATSLYEEATIRRLIDIYQEILAQLADLARDESNRSGLKVIDISYLSEPAYERLINTWNATDKEYPSGKTIQQLFEEQVEKTPDNVAIVYEETKLSYRELNERANRLAHYLKNNYDIQPDSLIGLCLDRSEHILIGILGVLKSGGAYVPMDPSYPEERIQFILEDAKCKVMLTNEAYQQRLHKISHLTDILALDSKSLQEETQQQSTNNLPVGSRSSDLAYVIYTSGTTGKPKGVLIEHKSVSNYIHNVKRHIDLSTKDKVDFSTNVGFDLTVTTTLCSLCIGAAVVVYGKELQDLQSYKEHIINSNITVVKLVPSYFELIVDVLPASKINKVILGGEKLSIGTIKQLATVCANREINIYDEYGPTEATVGTCIKEVAIAANRLDIGKPYANCRVYVLDSSLNPLPIGAIGELYIGGVGLAKGYLNRPELTKERFIVNPFQTEQEKQDKRYGESGRNARLYKTGDLVRWLPDGNLEYIGRNDFQVKIRGYRIELGEIESALLSYAGIKQAIVLAKEHKSIGTYEASSGSKYLVGYYVSDNKLDETVLLSYLQNKLPEYMVPNAFIHLEQLPLTINGKLDRKALPASEFTNRDHYVAPRNELETKICQIWADIVGLPVEKVGTSDDFFRLGGNSILAIKLVSRLSKELDKSIHVATIFKQSTVSKLLHYLKHNEEEEEVVIEKITVIHPEKQWLSFAQERLWFLEKYEQGTTAYNIPMVYRLSSECELDLLECSIRAIVDRHEILRTLIKEDNEGTGYQVVLEDAELLLKIDKVSITSQKQLDEALKKEANHIFNLADEYPIRICLYELSMDRAEKNNIAYHISIVVHHIAFDGWSVDIFLKELQTYYNYYLKQKRGVAVQLSLPALSIQYKDFALWQRNYLSGDRLDKQLSYWRSKLSGYESLNLITDKPRPSQIDYTGSDIYFELDKDTSIALRALAKQLKVSLYSVLLSGYYLMLRSYSNQDDIVVGTPIANRHYSQIEDLLGFFVNSLALRIQIEPTVRVKEFIEQVGAEVVEAQLHQDLPFEKLVEELKIAKDTSRHPLFQVMFSVQSFGGNLKSVASEKEEHKLAELLKPYTPENSLYQVAKFDLKTFIDDGGEKLSGVFNYATSLYNEATIHGFMEVYLEILKQLGSLASHVEKGKEIKIADLCYISDKQYELITNTWNATEGDFSADLRLEELIEVAAKQTPNLEALVFGDKALTYSELDTMANYLAHVLTDPAIQVQANELIALYLDQEDSLILTILGIWKAGAAFVPIDLNYPAERVRFIVEDSGAKCIITNQHHSKKLGAILEPVKTYIQIIEVETMFETQVSEGYKPKEKPKLKLTSDGLCYVTYTSGTTGIPKGVPKVHQSVVNSITDLSIRYNMLSPSTERVVLFSAYVFEPFIRQMLIALVNSQTLVIVPDAVKLDVEVFASFLKYHRITYLNGTYSVLQHLNLEGLVHLKRLLLVGEALAKAGLEKLRTQYNGEIINEYGFTENALVTTIKQYAASAGKSEHCNIGRPLRNVKCYVLSQTLKPVPIGAVGELYIGGIGLARGYLNRSELTKERFIVNPFQTEQEKQDKRYGESGRNARLYKTGDLVRWLPDGNLEYIGRNDFQVKIRGYRIELGEVESALLSYAGIKQAVVLAKEPKSIGTDESSSGSKYLVGYYVSDNKLDETVLLSYLQSKLPEYMVPSVLVYLEKLPLTINGKLDREALPDLAFTNSDTYVAPRNELEIKLCQVWAQVVGLPVDKVGISDDFFRLGGNSILAIKLVSRLSKELDNNIHVATIFRSSTICTLANYLNSLIQDNKAGEIYEF
jgi:amino acid adenylation domain-containing protein